MPETGILPSPAKENAHLQSWMPYLVLKEIVYGYGEE